MIRKVKGEEEVGIPLVFIYLSSSFFLRCKIHVRREVILLVCSPTIILSCLLQYSALIIGGVYGSTEGASLSHV